VTCCDNVGSCDIERNDADRRFDTEIDAGVGEPPLFDHRQHKRGGADLRYVDTSLHVGVADDDGSRRYRSGSACGSSRV